MAAEDDKKFDAVLSGFLLNDLRVRAGHLHCPESDTLAAYHQRLLLPGEMNSWKEHIVGCARCQAILAELEATDSSPLRVSEKEEVLTAVAAKGEAADEPIPPPKQVSATLPKKLRVTPISRSVYWQWLAPAGALAAGLLIWVAWHENRLSQVNTPAEVKTAKLEPSAAPPSPVTRDDRQAVSADEIARLSKDQGAMGGAAPAKPAPQAESVKQFEKSDSRGKVALAKPVPSGNSKGLGSSLPSADKERGLREESGRDLAAANRAQNQPAQDAKAGNAGAVSQTVEVQTLTANAQPQNQQAQQNLPALQNQVNEQKVSGPNPSRHLEQAKKSKAESPANLSRAAAPPPAPAAPTAAFSDNVRASSTLMAGGLVQHLIPAPGAKSLWRVGHMGMIEFSGDGGASWWRQISNVSVELTAGSAPSDKICWIAGQAGTILLTTDAGAYWVTIHSPLKEDLGGVRAQDALHATIWNAKGTKTFETSDGGLTWKPIASQ